MVCGGLRVYDARQNIEPSHFTRALELFPNDRDVLFFAASAHETFAGVRTQAVMRSIKFLRGNVSFGVQDEDAVLPSRRAAVQAHSSSRIVEHLEADDRLAACRGLRGRHKEAVDRPRQGQMASEPVLQGLRRTSSSAASSRRSVMAQRPGSRMNERRPARTAQSPLLDRAAARNRRDRGAA